MPFSVAYLSLPTRKTLSAFLFIQLTIASRLAIAGDPPPAKASEPKNNELTEIYVIGQKRKQSQSEVPGAISVISDDIVNTLNIKSLSDIAGLTPGLNVLDNGSRNPDLIIMRGIHFDGLASNDLGGDGATVASYVDGVPLQGYYAPPQLLLKDLEGVEVLRGPQGTLYGAASLSGTVLYKTKKPDLNEFSTYIGSGLSSTSYSDEFGYTTDVITNIPIIPSIFGMRIMASYEDRAGFIDNENAIQGPKEDLNDEQLSGGRLSARYAPSSNSTYDFMVQRQRSKVGGRQSDSRLESLRAYQDNAFYVEPSLGTLDTSALTAEYALPFALVTATLTYYDYQLEQRTDSTDLFRAIGFAKPSQFTYHQSTVDIVQKTAEIRMSTEFDFPVNAIVGAFASENSLGADIDYSVEGDELTNPELAYASEQTEDLDDIAVYGELNWKPADSLVLTAGARQFNYKDTGTFCDFYYGEALGCDEQGIDKSATSFKASALFQFQKQLTSYINVSEGFRRGGINLVLSDAMADQRSYKPDTTLNKEIGLHANLLDKRLNISTNIFHIDWSDVQIETTHLDPETAADAQPFFVNLGEAVSKGFEFESVWQASEALSITGSYSYTDAKLNETVLSYNHQNGGGDNGYKGDQLPGAPVHQMFAMISFKTPMFGFQTEFDFSARYQGDVHTQLNDEHENYSELSDYTMYNARMGFTQNNWQAFLFVDNLSNKRAVTGRQSTFGAFDYVNRPRTVGLEASYIF